jgi:hypothetical protein
MSDSKWTTAEISEKVDSEGLDYMITRYLDADSIEDPKLAELWRAAKAQLIEIESYLNIDGSNDADDEPPSESFFAGAVVDCDGRVLCDTKPAVFDRAPKDAYGQARFVSDHGGNIVLLEGVGFSGRDFEVNFNHEVETSLVIEVLRDIAPHAATHIPQHVNIDGIYVGLRDQAWFVNGRNSL